MTNWLPVFQPAKHLYKGSCLSYKQELTCCTLCIPKDEKKKPKHPKKTTKKTNQTKECQALVTNSNDEHWKNWILEEAKQVKFRIKVQFLKGQMWFNHLNKLQNKTMDFSLSIFKLRLLSFSGKYFMVSQVSYWIQHWWNLPSCSI